MSFSSYLKSRLPLIGWLTLGGGILTFFICDVCSTSLSWYLKVSTFTVVIWISMWLGNEYMAHVLDNKISWTKEPIKRFMAGIVTMLLYTVAVVFILVSLYKVAFEFDLGDISVMLYGTIITTTVITLFMTSRSFLNNWKQEAINAELLKKESITAQYTSLKNQVNPHFLFNSLNALTNLVYEDQDKAVKFIKQLSDVYRYVLDTRDQEVVALDDELKFLESYLFLQKIRFGDNLRVELSLSSEGKRIAPLALQMLIENAIKHNITSAENPLSITIKEQEGYLVVENSLQRKAVLEENSPGLGLENIKSRYHFLSNQPVLVEETVDKFIVKLPVIESEAP